MNPYFPAKYYVTKFTPFYKPSSVAPENRIVKHRDLIERTIVFVDPDVELLIGGRWCMPASFNDGFNVLVGYIPSENIEPFNENLPHNLVAFENQTASLLDAEQYLTYAGYVQYNLCGQICLAYALGKLTTEILDGWKAKDRKWWETFFNVKRTARGTSDGELIRLAKALGCEAKELSQAIKTESGVVRYTPERLKKLVENYHIIASCNIDPVTHQVNGSGILHWVYITEVFAERDGGGDVKFANSLSNAVELCSWREWLKTTRNAPYGVVIKKNLNMGDV